jgi:hypothetical protein
MLKFTVSGTRVHLFRTVRERHTDLKAVDDGVGILRGGFIDKPNEMFY